MRRILVVIGCLLLATVARAENEAGSLEPSSYPSLISSIRLRGGLEFCGETVPLNIPEVRERLDKELLLTLADRPQVILWLKRAHRYLPFIEQSLAAAEMPDDLKYIAVIESALRPHVGSPAGAIGFWQFMAETGRRYGLTIDDTSDERRNIFKSTGAALAYFEDLYGQFGSWTLAAAAYNMGEEGLQSEILLQQTNRYYRLYLPLETQRYVFRVIAAKLILTAPERYGFHLAPGDLYPPLVFDRIDVACRQRIPIRIVAQAAGTFFKVIKDLNPDIRGYYLPEGTHTILIPAGAALDFKPRFEKAVTAWRSDPLKRTYVVKTGDNLSVIAEAFGVPLPALLIWNDLDVRDRIHPGDRLVVYSPVPVAEAESTSAESAAD
jgi:hypothetical protein